MHAGQARAARPGGCAWSFCANAFPCGMQPTPLDCGGVRERGGACEAVAAALPPGGGTPQLPINNLGGCAWAHARARAAVRADYLRLVRCVNSCGGSQQLGAHYHPLLPVSRSARVLQCRAVPTPMCRHPSTVSSPAAALVAMLAWHTWFVLHAQGLLRWAPSPSRQPGLPVWPPGLLQRHPRRTVPGKREERE